jgi:hypothetical protein
MLTQHTKSDHCLSLLTVVEKINIDLSPESMVLKAARRPKALGGRLNA